MASTTQKLSQLKDALKKNNFQEFKRIWATCQKETKEKFAPQLIRCAQVDTNSEILVLIQDESGNWLSLRETLLKEYLQSLQQNFTEEVFERLIFLLCKRTFNRGIERLTTYSIKIEIKIDPSLIEILQERADAFQPWVFHFKVSENKLYFERKLALSAAASQVAESTVQAMDVSPTPVSEANLAGASADHDLEVPDTSSTIDTKTLLQLFQLDKFDEIRKFLDRDNHLFKDIDREEASAKLVALILDESLRDSWTIKDGNKVIEVLSNRDAALDSKMVVNDQKCKLGLRVLHLLNPVLYKSFLRPGATDVSRKLMQAWLDSHVKETKKYPSYDSSDDSDSDDDHALASNEASGRSKRLHKMQQQASPSFWRRTRRSDTGGKSSLIGRAQQALRAVDTAVSATAVRDLTAKTLKASGKLLDRATLATVGTQTQKFVAVYRGINYMPDRWNMRSKRAHFADDQTGKTQYAEAALMAAQNVYRDFSVATNEELQAEAAKKIEDTLRVFATTGPCIAHTVKPRKAPYVFNSFADYLQHCYSNGISQHLLGITSLLTEQVEWLQVKFPNAYNYALSTGERPYHSLRYALGLKDYYQYPFNPHYNSDGSIANFHAGKLHIFLFSESEYLNFPQMNRVTRCILEGRVPIEYNIASEVETTFMGRIPGEHLVMELPLRFPSFHKAYKQVYEVKYGFNKELYEIFQKLITSTSPLSDERNAVIELLKEWLCAYYEVLAISMAQSFAEQQNGQLVYINPQNQTSATPPVRTLTPGHHEEQNQTHVLQNVRWLIADEVLRDEDIQLEENAIYFPEINLALYVDEVQREISSALKEFDLDDLRKLKGIEEVKWESHKELFIKVQEMSEHDEAYKETKFTREEVVFLQELMNKEGLVAQSDKLEEEEFMAHLVTDRSGVAVKLSVDQEANRLITGESQERVRVQTAKDILSANAHVFQTAPFHPPFSGQILNPRKRSFAHYSDSLSEEVSDQEVSVAQR